MNVAACYILTDDFHAAQPYAEKAVAFYERRPSGMFRPHNALSQTYLGLTLARAGDFEAAEQRLDSALALGVRNPGIRAMAQIYAAGVYLNRGRLADAGRFLEEVLAMPKLSEDFRLAAETLLSAQKYYMEDFAGSLTLARQAMARKTTLFRLTANAAVMAQACLTELGDLREAQTLEAGLSGQMAEAPRNLQGAALRASAELALKRGDLDRAREQAERAASFDSTPNAQASCLLIQAEVFLLRQNFQRAASLTDAVLRSEAIDFYKRRARALQSRLAAAPAPALP